MYGVPKKRQFIIYTLLIRTYNKHNETVLTLLPMKDHIALEKTIIEILNSPEQREKLGTAARKRVEELFSVETFVKNMSDQYPELARGAKSVC